MTAQEFRMHVGEKHRRRRRRQGPFLRLVPRASRTGRMMRLIGVCDDDRHEKKKQHPTGGGSDET